jgi:protein gp37
MTAIEWTHVPGYTGRTWNPVTGCEKIAQGCKNCYAEALAHRFWKGRKFTDVQTHADRLDQPLRARWTRIGGGGHA